MADYFDHGDVQEWIDAVEETLEGDIGFDLTTEEEELYNELETHYETAKEIIEEEGLTDTAAYELEVADDILDSLGYELQLKTEPRGDMDWQEWYEDNL